MVPPVASPVGLLDARGGGICLARLRNLHFGHCSAAVAVPIVINLVSMSSSHAPLERREPRVVSIHRLAAVVVVLFVLAYYLIMFVLWRAPGLSEQQPSSNAPSVQSATNKDALRIEELTPAARGAATPHSANGEVAHGVERAPRPAAALSANRPISAVLTAPVQVADGSTFEVSVGVPAGSGVYSASFQIDYDDDALEILDMTDATGETRPLSRSQRGSVKLDVGRGLPAKHPVSIRFLLRGAARSVEVAVTAELWDEAGNALPSAVLKPYSIIVDP